MWSGSKQVSSGEGRPCRIFIHCECWCRVKSWTAFAGLHTVSVCCDLALLSLSLTQCIMLEPLVCAKMRLTILTPGTAFPQAVAFGEEGDKAKAKSLAASAEARKAKAGLRRLKDQIQATMIDLEALKKQLVVSGNYVPMEEQPASRESLASSPRGVWGRSASRRQQRQRSARGGTAKQLGISDERVPVDVVSTKQAQY